MAVYYYAVEPAGSRTYLHLFDGPGSRDAWLSRRVTSAKASSVSEEKGRKLLQSPDVYGYIHDEGKRVVVCAFAASVEASGWYWCRGKPADDWMIVYVDRESGYVRTSMGVNLSLIAMGAELSYAVFVGPLREPGTKGL